jgi:hypothetical protein
VIVVVVMMIVVMIVMVVVTMFVLMLMMVVASLIADMNMIARHARLAQHRAPIPRTTAGIAHIRYSR